MGQHQDTNRFTALESKIIELIKTSTKVRILRSAVSSKFDDIAMIREACKELKVRKQVQIILPKPSNPDIPRRVRLLGGSGTAEDVIERIKGIACGCEQLRKETDNKIDVELRLTDEPHRYSVWLGEIRAIFGLGLHRSLSVETMQSSINAVNSEGESVRHNELLRDFEAFWPNCIRCDSNNFPRKPRTADSSLQNWLRRFLHAYFPNDADREDTLRTLSEIAGNSSRRNRFKQESLVRLAKHGIISLDGEKQPQLTPLGRLIRGSASAVPRRADDATLHDDVFDCIRTSEEGGISALSIRNQLDETLDIRRIQAALYYLQAEGLVTKQGANKGSRWRVVVA